MTTPIIMLGILALPLLVAWISHKGKLRSENARRAAAWGLGAVFCFTGVGHFLKTEAMATMLPAWVPAPLVAIQLSGLCELALGSMFFLDRTRRLAGILAMAALVLLYPLNVYAAFARAPMGGHAWGPSYLWARTPLQLILFLWAYWFVARKPESVSR